MLKVQLLAGFRIFLDKEDISSLFSERVRLLLAYVLLNPESPISRKQIAYTFWPDSVESQARTNLRNLLHHLRKSLGEASNYLEVDILNIQVKNIASINLDVWAFNESISAAETSHDAQTRISYLQQAVSQYRGELLPGHYEGWLLKEREWLHQSFINVLLKLGTLLEDNQQYQEAIQVIDRLIQVDPLNEPAYQHSMRLHALSNDRIGALKVFHTCSTVLMQELNVEPSQETQSYYKQILQLADTAIIDAKEKHTPDAKIIVGRQHEWQSLRKAWQVAVKGIPKLVLILGEAGIGKTRLANEMAFWTRRQGINTAYAQCYQGEGDLPYAPIISWLRTPEFEREIKDLDPVWQNELARLLPEYENLSQLDESQNKADQKWQRRRLFEAMAKGILGYQKPRLLILDDAHWCDQDSLEFIRYLLHYDTTAPILIILTARSEELTPTNPVHRLRMLLQSKQRIQEIELEVLTNEDVRKLVANLTKNNFQEELIDRLYEESEGNPLFVIEMLRSVEASLPESMPLSIRSLIEYRLSQLSKSASALAGNASSIGREFSYRLLEASCGLDEEMLVHSLDELWLRKIIKNQQGDTYYFTHGKLREVAYESLSGAQRRLNHQHIAKALLSISREDAKLESGLTAKHFELARQYDQAVDQYIKAANASRRVFANRNAKLYLEQALSLISERTDLDDEQKKKAVEIKETLGDIYEITGDREIAMDIYPKALEQVPENDDLTKARILGKIAKVHATKSGFEHADEKFMQAVDALGRPPDESNIAWWRAWLDIQFERVWMYYNLADIEGMETTLETLLPVINRLNASDKLIAYQYNLVGLHFRRDRYRVDESTKKLSFETLKKCQEFNNSEYLIRATVGYGLASLWSRDLDNAKKYLKEGLKLAEQAGEVINQIISLTYLAVTSHLLNNPDLCQTYAKRALVLCEREDEPTYAASARANLGWVAWREGKMHKAKELSLNALENWSEYYPFRWLALWTLIDINWQEGQLEKAIELIRQLIDSRQQALPEEREIRLTSLVITFEQGKTKQSQKNLSETINWAKESHYL